MSNTADSDHPETDVPMETDDEQIIHKLAQIRADSTRLNRLATEYDVPAELAGQLGFMTTDIDTLAMEVAEYIVDGDPLPDVCPVCGDPVTTPANGFEAGESHAVERLCIAETSSLGVSQSIIHYETDGDRPDLPELKFASEHIDPILAGRKTVTIRLADPNDLPAIGDRVRFCDQSGERFATAIVDDRGYTTVEMAARMELEGHRSYDETDALLEQLREYYPDEQIDANTRVELVYWNAEDCWE